MGELVGHEREFGRSVRKGKSVVRWPRNDLPQWDRKAEAAKIDEESLWPLLFSLSAANEKASGSPKAPEHRRDLLHDDAEAEALGLQGGVEDVVIIG